MTFEWKREWLSLIVIVAAFLGSILLYFQLPDPMPIHWNAAGQPDDYASRLIGAFLLPISMIIFYFLLLFLPRIDPQRTNVERFSETYSLIRTIIIFFFAYIHGVILYTVITHQDQLVTSFIIGGVGLLLILIGNQMPRMRSNWFMGIRTPWTLSSESVWRKTHRLGGRLFMLAGLLMILTPLFDPNLTIWFIIGLILLTTIVPIGYSYWLYQQEERATQVGG